MVMNFDTGKMQEIWQALADYPEMDFEQKVAYVQRVDQLIGEFLLALSQSRLRDEE